MTDLSFLDCFEPGLVKLERVNYFPRQLLDAEAMRTEQAYFLQKLRRHNRYLHGWGVVCGLEVTAAPVDDKPRQVEIGPGYALDGPGNEINVGMAVRLDLEANLLIHHNHLRLHRQTLRLFEEGLLEEAQTSMEIAEASYRQGEISFMDYLDARRTYQSIQIEHRQALYDWHLERATLDRAAGGGTL